MLKRYTTIVPILLALLVLSMATVAMAERVRPNLEVGARVFASYLYNFSFYDSDYDARSGRNGFNRFELDRGELILQGWSSRFLSGELLAEARRVEAYTVELEDGETSRVYPDNYGDFQLLLKHAFIFAHIVPQFNIRAGMIPSPYMAAEDKGWRYRFVEETVTQRGGLGWNEADIGVELTGAFPRGYGQYSLGVMNGEGYRRPEDNKYKALFSLLQLNPFAAFSKGKTFALVYAARYEVEDNPPGPSYDAVLNHLALVSYEVPGIMTFGAEFNYQADYIDDNFTAAEGIFSSVFGSARLVNNLWLLVRGDLYDFNIANSSSKESRRASRITGDNLDSHEDGEILILGGFAYDLSKYFRLALTYRGRFWEQTYPDGQKEGDVILPEHMGKASLEFGF